MTKTFRTLTFLALCTAQPVIAEESGLQLELNSANDVEGACRLSFLVRNGLGADVTTLVMETVIFTTDDRVERLTLFDFQDVPAGRPRVRQFDLSGTACSGVGSLLINGVETCDGEGLSVDACQAALRLSSRADIGVDG